ncbi:MAG TPA: molybdopterin-dependent oxidoreductase [Gemmatimonadales bacterium]|nr:molybdopterin-dependent oxidoreductase [Gemmatimonadales bacterium]
MIDRTARHRLDRRDFVRLGLLAGPTALVAACGWDGGGLIRPKLRAISRLNDWVGEKLLVASDRLAPTYPTSARAGHMPSYFISRRTPVPRDPANWALEVGGLVRHPMRFTRSMLELLPPLSYTVKHFCVEGWTTIASWSGVPVTTIAALVEPLPEARYLRFESFDNNYFNGWDLASAMHPQTMLAYAFNDQPLMPDHGAPVRLYATVKLGYKLTKYLTRMTFTRERPGGYWEDQGYPWFAGI